jgi:hypothetical protein
LLIHITEPINVFLDVRAVTWYVQKFNQESNCERGEVSVQFQQHDKKPMIPVSTVRPTSLSRLCNTLTNSFELRFPSPLVSNRWKTISTTLSERDKPQTWNQKKYNYSIWWHLLQKLRKKTEINGVHLMQLYENHLLLKGHLLLQNWKEPMKVVLVFFTVLQKIWIPQLWCVHYWTVYHRSFHQPFWVTCSDDSRLQKQLWSVQNPWLIWFFEIWSHNEQTPAAKSTHIIV